MAERKVLYISPGEKGKRGFEDLECFQLALVVMVKVHEFAKGLPGDEKFDMFSQIRRSSKSVTANISEGYGHYHYLDSLRFYSIARGELNETLGHLINAKVLNYLDQKSFDEYYKLIRETEQILNGYMAYVRRQRAGSQELGDKSIHEEAEVYITEQDE
jgi:four helix bundle protein